MILQRNSTARQYWMDDFRSTAGVPLFELTCKDERSSRRLSCRSFAEACHENFFPEHRYSLPVSSACLQSSCGLLRYLPRTSTPPPEMLQAVTQTHASTAYNTHTHTNTHVQKLQTHVSQHGRSGLTAILDFVASAPALIDCRQVRSVVRNTEVSTVPLVSLPRCELQGHCTSDASSAAGATCSGRSMHGESGRGATLPRASLCSVHPASPCG